MGQAKNAVPPAKPHLRLYYVDTTLSFFILHASGEPRLHFYVTTAFAGFYFVLVKQVVFDYVLIVFSAFLFIYCAFVSVTSIYYNRTFIICHIRICIYLQNFSDLIEN